MTRGRCGSLFPPSCDFSIHYTSPVLPAHKEPNMIIIGVDYHPSDQYIAFVDTETAPSREEFERVIMV
jgi:hypothetical protein